VDDETFYVESSDGKICYRVSGDVESCRCGDFVRNSKTDPDFKCKHLLAVMNSIPTGEIENGQILEKKRPKLDDRFIIEIEGNEFVKYPGLLDLGHQKGISQIEVDIIQIPNSENKNSAICKATVVSKVGETFTDVGDANPQNCNSKVSKHLLRMASTRAIARALRSFTNVGLTALEELGDLNDVLGKNTRKTKPKAKKSAASKPKAAGKQTRSQPKANAKKPKTDKADAKASQTAKAPKSKTKSEDQEKSSQPNMSEAQKRAIYNLSRRRGISVEELEQMALDAYNCELENLNSKDASSFIRNLQQAA
jgi:flagellar biosynthesis GTPase FlhF